MAARSQGRRGRRRRVPALPAARRRRRDRPVQLPAASLSRARRARRCSRATPSSIKPSDITPLCGQRYAEAAHAAKLPAGVLNVVVGHGRGRRGDGRGARSCAACASPAAGRSAGASSRRRSIARSCSSRSRWAARTSCVVLDDCALRQAVHEVVVGGYLSAGQRCTGTERVLVHRKIADRFIDALAKVRARAEVRQPRGRERVRRARSRRTARSTKVEAAIEAARKAGAEPIVAGAEAARRLLPLGVAAPAARRRAPRRRLHRSRSVRPGSVRRGDRLRRGGDRGDRCEPVRLRQRRVHRLARAVRAVRDAHEVRHAQPQPLDEPREPEAAVRRRRPERQLPARRRVGASQRDRAARDARERARRGHAAPAARGALAGGRSRSARARSTPPRRTPRRRARSSTCRGRCASSARRAACCPRARRCSRGSTPAIACRRRRSRRCSITCARPGRGWCRSTPSRSRVLDGMSQTATVVGGFAEDPVVRAYTEGEFADTLVANEDTAHRRDLGGGRVRERAAPARPGPAARDVRRVGAEANEKAMALCRDQLRARPNATKVLAFEGSFHGRTLLVAARDALAEQARAVRARRLPVHVRAVPGVGRRRATSRPRRAASTPRRRTATSTS